MDINQLQAGKYVCELTNTQAGISVTSYLFSESSLDEMKRKFSKLSRSRTSEGNIAVHVKLKAYQILLVLPKIGSMPGDVTIEAGKVLTLTTALTTNCTAVWYYKNQKLR